MRRKNPSSAGNVIVLGGQGGEIWRVHSSIYNLLNVKGKHYFSCLDGPALSSSLPTFLILGHFDIWARPETKVAASSKQPSVHTCQ